MLCIGPAVNSGISAGPQYRACFTDDALLDSALCHVMQRPVDIIFHSSKFNLSVFDDGVRRPGVSIARLANAAWVNYLGGMQLQIHWYVRMSGADEVDVDMFKSLLPFFPHTGKVLVHRISWRGVNQQKAMIADGQMLSHRHLRQPRQMLIVQNLKVPFAHRGSHLTKGASRSYSNPLRY